MLQELSPEIWKLISRESQIAKLVVFSVAPYEKEFSNFASNMNAMISSHK